MIKDGCLEGVDEIYGMHNWPSIPFMQLHSIPGPNMAEVTRPKITIIGKGGHGSDPALSNNPIIPALRIYKRYIRLMDEEKSKGHAFNGTLPMFKAGTAMNVVPDTALITGTFRSLEEGFVHVFMEKVEEIIKEECNKQHCQYKFVYDVGSPIVNNHK
jgi:metal-dependent amidase/aminoacylase/carboxypeptidase family protein